MGVSSFEVGVSASVHVGAPITACPIHGLRRAHYVANVAVHGKKQAVVGMSWLWIRQVHVRRYMGTLCDFLKQSVGRGDDTVGNPHRTQIYQIELFKLILLLKLDKQLPVEQFEAAVSQSTVPSPLLKDPTCSWVRLDRDLMFAGVKSFEVHIYIYIHTYTSLSLSIYIYICLSLSLSLYIYIYIH